MSRDRKENVYIGLLVVFWLGMLILYWPVALVFLVFAAIVVFNLRDREKRGTSQDEEDR